MDNLFIILEDFVLSYIIEPNKKVYYVAETDKLICTENKLSAHKYVNKLAAQSIIDHIKSKFDIDFSIERL